MWRMVVLSGVLLVCVQYVAATSVKKLEPVRVKEEVARLQPDPCTRVLCPHGFHCISKERQCRQDPCPLVAVCDPTRNFPNYCHLPANIGNCSTPFPPERRYFYDVTSGKCQSFLFSGCGGNENNYLSYHHCERSCIRQEECFLKPETGPCRARFERWYYDVFEGACKKFVYGGCQGNGNNYPTFDACIQRCFVAEFDDNLNEQALLSNVFEG